MTLVCAVVRMSGGIECEWRGFPDEPVRRGPTSHPFQTRHVSTMVLAPVRFTSDVCESPERCYRPGMAWINCRVASSSPQLCSAIMRSRAVAFVGILTKQPFREPSTAPEATTPRPCVMVECVVSLESLSIPCDGKAGRHAMKRSFVFTAAHR